ncbi:Snake venom 5'-nucleotidase [Nymphon striatum]|nr:Snake venom 5'-nucleotidase [Nymphon striatum]
MEIGPHEAKIWPVLDMSGTMNNNNNILVAFAFAFIGMINVIHAQIDLTILHTNDYHSFFDGRHEDMSACQPGKNKDTCYGTVSRLAQKIKELRVKFPEALLLDAGDFMHGSKWYTYLSWKPAVKFMNLMNYTTVSLGNHEFDDGVFSVEDYIRHALFPILCSNIKSKNANSVLNTKVKKSIVKNIGGTQVGIIGYITPHTLFLGNNLEDVEIWSVIKSLKKEAQELKNRGVNIIIGLGHAGYKRDIEIAKAVPDLDIVVGGHSHSLLYNGIPPILSAQKEDDYPIVVPAVGKRTSQALVIQSYSSAMFLGFLRVQFDKKGDVTGFTKDSNPIVIDSKIPKDKIVNGLYVKLRRQFESKDKEIVGQTEIFLNGSRVKCRIEECNLGNLIADAYAEHYKPLGVSLALVAGGGIRASIPKAQYDTVRLTTHFAVALIVQMFCLETLSETIGLFKLPRNASFFIDSVIPMDRRNVSNGHVISVLPFVDTIEVVQVTGAQLYMHFENSVSLHNLRDGRFLQVSGLYEIII